MVTTHTKRDVVALLQPSYNHGYIGKWVTGAQLREKARNLGYALDLEEDPWFEDNAEYLKSALERGYQEHLEGMVKPLMDKVNGKSEDLVEPISRNHPTLLDNLARVVLEAISRQCGHPLEYDSGKVSDARIATRKVITPELLEATGLTEGEIVGAIEDLVIMKAPSQRRWDGRISPAIQRVCALYFNNRRK